MGFWKDVAYDMSQGMGREDAIRLNVRLRTAQSDEERKKYLAEADAICKLSKMK